MKGLWFLVALLVGVVNSLTIVWVVERLQPEAERAALRLLRRSLVLRLLLAALVLVLALREGLGSALLAMGGLWAARWLLILWVAREGVDASTRPRRWFRRRAD